MRELILRVPREAAEDVLDRLLPIAPDGVREIAAGAMIELRLRGADLPSRTELARVAGGWRYELSEHEISDDWRERRLADYRPEPIGGRVVVRPDWAPAPAPEPGAIDIVLSEGSAFGAGTHPTTRACMELLLELEGSGGAFADLGCGSGVLAILAARLGCSPVIALDLQLESVETTRRNAAANGVTVAVRVADLEIEPPPGVDAFAANVPTKLHARIAAGLGDPPPAVAVVSGFGPVEIAAVSLAYAAAGLHVRRRVEARGWAVLQLVRD